MIGSHTAAVGTSVAAGGDSALSATGVCAPAPGLFITDDASTTGAASSILSATSPLPCNGPQPPAPGADGLYWFKADAGVTHDGLSRVSQWNDQFPNHWDVTPIDAFGVIGPPGTWPVFSNALADQINGLPVLQYRNASTMSLQHNFFAGCSNFPAASLPAAVGVPVSVFASLRVKGPDLGIIVTHRLNDDDLELGIRRGVGAEYIIASQQDAHGLFHLPQTDRTGEILAFAFIFNGSTSATCTINGVPLPLLPAGTPPLGPSTGECGFNIGSIPAVFHAYLQADLLELLAYKGTDAARDAAAYAYIRTRAGV